jgi:hypothetical protein
LSVQHEPGAVRPLTKDELGLKLREHLEDARTWLFKAAESHLRGEFADAAQEAYGVEQAARAARMVARALERRS